MSPGPRSVAEIAHANFEGTRLLVIFKAFGDESEVRGGGTRVFSVAVALGEPETWGYFPERWRAVLSDYGARLFHANQFEAGRGPYEGWSNVKRVEFISSLIEVINGAQTMWFSTTLVRNDYEALSETERDILGTPYELCVEWTVRNVATLLGSSPWEQLDGRVLYVFEQTAPRGTGRLCGTFERALKACPERRLAGRPSWARKDDFLELQVADLFAYEVGKDALRDIGADDRGPRKSLLAIDRFTPRRHYRFDASNLRHVIDRGLTDFARSDVEAFRGRHCQDAPE